MMHLVRSKVQEKKNIYISVIGIGIGLEEQDFIGIGIGGKKMISNIPNI